jgi:UDP-2,4-diacetamido-2,4,6-trideoxy-beta-L-altropyranose hydrolase
MSINQNLSHLLIRADANSEIGSGHVMRMIALSQAYKDRGGQITFVCTSCPKTVADRLQKEQFQLETLQSVEPGSSIDAQETIKLGKALKCRWIVADGYQFSITFQRSIQKAGFKLLIVDDHGYSNEWAADAILNQNIFAQDRSYESETKNCRKLLGMEYSMLRREFIKHSRNKEIDEPKEIRKVLITLGGGDPSNATGKIIQALNKINTSILSIRIILGASNRNKNTIQNLIHMSPHSLQLFENVDDMPMLYQWADGVISAGGSTCWEWMYYGIPSCAVAIADNQLPIVEKLAAEKQLTYLGWHESLNPQICAEKIKLWLQKPTIPNQSNALDGRGANRVAAMLDGSLRITIASAKKSWINEHLNHFIARLNNEGHKVDWVHDGGSIQDGDILFLLSFWSLLPEKHLQTHTQNLVVHESDLPKGRGWSPLTWQIIEGKNEIPVCLFEAVNTVDAGPIYLRDEIKLEGHELLNEIRDQQSKATIVLCLDFVKNYPEICAKRVHQKGQASYYQKRTPEDSRINLSKTIKENFALLRTVDNEIYPAYFELNGHTYSLKIEKISPNNESTT